MKRCKGAGGNGWKCEGSRDQGTPPLTEPHRLRMWDSFISVIGAPCGPGEYFDPGSSECVPCEPGTFMDQHNHHDTDCNLCDPGYYAPDEGSVDCDSCLPGTFQPTLGGTICFSCPPGGYSSNADSISCTICDFGHYCPGGTDQMPCPANTYAEQTGRNNILTLS